MVKYKLYYDDNGRVVCYTCDDFEGNYIEIDSQTFAEARPDVRVVDGKIVRTGMYSTVSILEETTNGTRCALQDINIIVPSDYKGPSKCWDVKIYEFKND